MKNTKSHTELVVHLLYLLVACLPVGLILIIIGMTRLQSNDLSLALPFFEWGFGLMIGALILLAGLGA